MGWGRGCRKGGEEFRKGGGGGDGEELSITSGPGLDTGQGVSVSLHPLPSPPPPPLPFHLSPPLKQAANTGAGNISTVITTLLLVFCRHDCPKSECDYLHGGQPITYAKNHADGDTPPPLPPSPLPSPEF